MDQAVLDDEQASGRGREALALAALELHMARSRDDAQRRIHRGPGRLVAGLASVAALVGCYDMAVLAAALPR